MLLARIQKLQQELADLQDQLKVQNASARGKPRSAARLLADQMRVRKQVLLSQISATRNRLQAVRNQILNFIDAE
jgi:hypothetical protein